MRKLLLLLTFSITSLLTAAQIPNLKSILDKKRSTVIDTTFHIKGKNNQTAEVPITLISGEREGPTFTIMAGIHGMEYPTILSLLEIRREINPKKLKGNLIIIPIVNTEPFFRRVPFVNPKDNLNLNRIFPGNPDGTISEAIAHFITREIFSSTDVLLDLHGGDVGEDLIPFMCYYENKEFVQQTKLAARLSEISGFDTIVSYPYILPNDKPAMYAFKQAVRQGIPALSVEIGKLGNSENQEVELAKEAIFRMMAEMKMYNEHELKSIGPIKARYTQQAYISVPAQGIFYSKVKAGDKIEKDAEIGYITDLFDNKTHTIIAPETGVVLYKVGTPPVNKGETLFCIGYNP